MDKASVSSVQRGLDPGWEPQLQDSRFSFRAFAISVLSEVSSLLVQFHQRRQERYQNLLINLSDQNNGAVTVFNLEKKSVTLSTAVTESILERLKQFERQKGYLSNEISLNSLAKQLGTNSSYLSKVINLYKGKSFKNYLNELRIETAYADLQAHPWKKKYTIEALAQEYGFKSAESFSKKFRAAYGMYPSKFLRDLV